MQRILVLCLIVVLGSGSGFAQTPATPALDQLTVLEQTLELLRGQVAATRVLLEAIQPCPPPVICPECPPPVICPPPIPQVPFLVDSADMTAKSKIPGDYNLTPDVRYVVNISPVSGVRFHGALNLPEGRVATGATSHYRIVPADQSRPSVFVLQSGVEMTGIYFQQGTMIDRNVVQVGSSFETDPLKQPERTVFDRVEMAAGLTGGKRGFELHSRSVTISHSRVTGFWYHGEDAQAIFACNGPGPYNILDNYLEGSGENILFGGGSIRSAGMIPSGTISGNWLFKPQSWRTNGATVKNLLEIKAGKGVTIENNVLDGNWLSGQTGSALLLTPRNQYNDSPWTIVADITIRWNLWRNHTDGYAINILGRDNVWPSQQTARVTVEHNYMSDSPKGIQIIGGVAESMIVRDNAFPKIKGQWWTFGGSTTIKTPLTVERNVALSGSYGINGDGTGVGTPTLTVYTILVSWIGNVVEKTPERTIPWPTGTELKAVGALAPLLDVDGHYIPGGAGW